jgi:hypothetical protein
LLSLQLSLNALVLNVFLGPMTHGEVSCANAWQVDEKAAALLLPYMLEGVRSSAHRELRLATYMMIMQLISRSSPAPQLLDGECLL